MHLEKVTTRSSEAAVAGWISSNDATLFTTVVVVAAAIFLHSRLSQGAKANAALAAEKTQLAETLSARTDELAGLGDVLRQTSERLHLTQEDRDKLRQQLAEKLDQIARLNARLDQLLAEHGDLQRQSAATAAERDAAASASAGLRERLDALSAELEQKLAAMESLAQERDRLEQQANELDAIVAGLREKLRQLDVQVAESAAQAAARADQSQRQVSDLEARLAASAQQAADYLAQLKKAQQLAESLELQKQQLHQAMTAADAEHQRQLLEEGRNNRELVGLRGPLKRVAVVIDASGSMRQLGAQGGRDRWADAQAVAAKWLQHLNVEHCVLVVFSSDVRTFPADGTLVDLRGEAGKARREALLAELRAVVPGGWTNTLDALRKAYAYDVDTILLLSDGAPSRADTGLFDPNMADQIYQLCRAHRDIPINTIGLGDYFDDAMATFLRTVAELTGGTFRGQ
ncbi:MAG: hypothetical protein DCC67_04535 [Planctomycetota bacterium]|nr:MAG: hypothetical protein DCC67_04535 [Planctomycetota bacterium]